MKILVLNGPNLNLLGEREPEIYGKLTLDELNHEIARYTQGLNEKRAEAEKIELGFFQSNHEGVLIDTIQEARLSYEGIIYNPAAHTHYSIAIRDAITSISIPVVEVHLSDINAREGFRAFSLMKDICIAQCAGKHLDSYTEALEVIVAFLDGKEEA